MLKTASDANNFLALFIRDQFALSDRGHAIDMVKSYLEEMSTSKPEEQEGIVVFFKFDFLKIIVDYEHYIQLNHPLPYQIESVQNLSQILW
jgi:hypothetical protein